MATKANNVTKTTPAGAENNTAEQEKLPIVTGGALALTEDMGSLISADMGGGAEEIDADSFSIPYLTILQALSQAAQDHVGDPNYMQGMIYNSATGETFKEVEFIPCHFQRRFVRWEEGAAAGAAAFQGIYTPAELESLNSAGMLQKNAKGRFTISDDRGTGELIDTRLHYVLFHNVNLDVWEPALISLSKTQVKYSKRLMTMIRTIQFRIGNKSVNPPSWANVYKASSIKEKNDMGQWFSWNFTRVGPVTDKDLYLQAKDLHDSVLKGDAKAATPVDDSAGAAADNPF